VQCWLNHGVVGEIAWPRTETSFHFGDNEIVAKPPTAQHEASLHIDLVRYGIDGPQAMSLLSQVLSLASWVDDTYSILLPGWSGSPVPIAVPRSSNCWPSSILDAWPNSRGPISDADARCAIAIYREALNAERYHSIPYAALGYYKLLEIRYGRKKPWLQTLIAGLAEDGDETLLSVQREFAKPASDIPVLLRDDIRHAVAHAAADPRVNPDDVGKLRRLSLVLPLLRTIARTFIRDKLGVSEDRWAI
jgi:hypothetical protein